MDPTRGQLRIDMRGFGPSAEIVPTVLLIIRSSCSTPWPQRQGFPVPPVGQVAIPQPAIRDSC